MSKRIRNLILLSALLVVSVLLVVAAVFLFSDDAATDDPTQGGTQTTVPTTPNLNPEVVISDKQFIHGADGSLSNNTVTAVTVTNKNGSYTLSPREKDGLLTVAAYHDLPRDATAITEICDNLLRMVAIATPTVQEEDDAYGFNDPTAVVEASYADGTTQVFRFGLASSGTDGYYCRLDGNDTLYIVSTSIVDIFLTHGKDLIGKTLIAPPSVNDDDTAGVQQLLDLKLVGTCREQPIHITTDTDASYPSLTYMSTFVIKAPYLRAVDSDAFYTTAQTMLSLTAAGVELPNPTAEDMERYGISTDPTKSYSVASFILSVVATSSAEGGGTLATHYNDREHMIILGNKNEQGYYYAMVDGYPVIYLLAPASVPWAEYDYYDVTSKLLFIKDITTIDTITVTDNGTPTQFDLSHSVNETTGTKNLTVTIGETPYDTADFRTLYQLLLSIHRSARKDAGSAPAGEAVLQVEIAFNDGEEPMSIALYPMSSSRYLLVTNDGEEVAVSISDTNVFVKQLHNYLAGLPVTTPMGV